MGKACRTGSKREKKKKRRLITVNGSSGFKEEERHCILIHALKLLITD